MTNYYRKGNRTESAYATSTSRLTTTVTSMSAKRSEASKFSPWDSAQMWIESISKEDSTRKQWESMYGWMGDIDEKGNLKPKKTMEQVPVCSAETIPDSSGHNYGWHLQTNIGKEIKNLQTRLDRQYKKHLPTVVLGYD